MHRVPFGQCKGGGGGGGGGGGDIVPTAKCTAEGLHLQVKNKHLSLRDVI